MSKREINFSASRVKSLSKCSYAFYLSEIERLPERIWERTIIGTLVHSILECLRRPRHLKNYHMIVDKANRKVDYKASPSITRLINIYQRKYNIAQELIDDINGMLEVALVHYDFFFSGAKEIYPPEMEIIKRIGDARIKLIIDASASFGNRGRITDYKSQKNRFTAEELEFNIQALLYASELEEKYGIPFDVEFVMLRHPPTKRLPEKHIQRVFAPTKEQVAGLREYIQFIYSKINNFTLEDAYRAPCTDESFCSYVCSYRKPFDYFKIYKNNEFIRSIRDNGMTPQLNEGETMTKEHFSGCPIKNI